MSETLPFKAYLGVTFERTGQRRLLAGPYYGETAEAAIEVTKSRKYLAEKWGEANIRDWDRYYPWNEWTMFSIAFASGDDPGHEPVAGILEPEPPEPEKPKRKSRKAPREVTSYRHTVPA